MRDKYLICAIMFVERENGAIFFLFFIFDAKRKKKKGRKMIVKTFVYGETISSVKTFCVLDRECLCFEKKCKRGSRVSTDIEGNESSSYFSFSSFFWSTSPRYTSTTITTTTTSTIHLLSRDWKSELASFAPLEEEISTKPFDEVGWILTSIGSRCPQRFVFAIYTIDKL